jgi:ATP-dependent DNA ligase
LSERWHADPKASLSISSSAGRLALTYSAPPVGLCLEGLMSKRRDRPYRAGRSKHWVKVKNRKHPAMEREEFLPMS